MAISVQRLVALAALLLAGAAADARAQTSETVTNVPFEFTAGSASLPRDQYRISPMPGQNGAFMIRGARVHHGAVLMSRTDRGTVRDPAPSLTFHRYGDTYFLREVQLADGRILQLSQTRAEVEAAELAAAQATTRSTVVVASNSAK